MDNINPKDKKIFEDMKQCFIDYGLKIIKEEELGGNLCGMSTYEYAAYNMGIGFIFDPAQSFIDLSIRYADFTPDKIPEVYELINFINLSLINCHFSVEPHTRMVLLRTGMSVTGYFLNKTDFKALLGQVMGGGHTFFPLIAKLHLPATTTKSIIDEFLADKNMEFMEFLGLGGKTEEAKPSVELPFIIHASKGMPAFPTHTHGLTELGMPEFLMDHLAFGADGNGGRINASYDYFTKPENTGKLESIKNGKTIKLTDKDLKPDGKPGRSVYCYRRVYPDFQMIKEAYDLDDPNQVSPTTWFVQIYVEGDDFALTDDYYKGGIKF